jgi:hypothetical protein
VKVPYLNKKIRDEFREYLDELKLSVEQSTTLSIDDLQNQNPAHLALFRQMYSLFVLLRKLSDSDYFSDPSRNIVLADLQTSGNKAGFLEALACYSKPSKFIENLKRGASAQTFSGYFNELFSDGLMLCNSYYTFNYRGAMISVRCMLEDLYRHLYYKDHLQEFYHVNSGLSDSNNESGIGLTPSGFRSYLRRASYLCRFLDADENFAERTRVTADGDAEGSGAFISIFDVNEQLYGECSAFVHGSGKTAMSQFQSNFDLAFSQQNADLVCGKVKRFTDMAIAFLIAAHLEHFNSFNEYDRSIILSGYSLEKRKNFRMLINV